ncbi:MAG: hypothetical protein WDZ85_02835 [Candidatus Paceibacterota bacterium]
MSEDNETLEEILDLAKENHQILVKMRRAQNIATLFSILKLLVITGLAVGIYYFLQPLLAQLGQVYSGVDDLYQSTGSIFENLRQTLTP